jgi:hypothetical protein
VSVSSQSYKTCQDLIKILTNAIDDVQHFGEKTGCFKQVNSVHNDTRAKNRVFLNFVIYS